MNNRRQFLKQAMHLTGMAGAGALIPESIARAFAIEPQAGSSFLDAEHVVILMQENRSFDHCFGTLQGVRGFNDPRAIRLSNGNPVWLQQDRNGRTFAPFQLNMQETRATWMGSIPHSWTDQVDAANGGWHDGWIEHKKSSREAYADVPLTMGFVQRDDIPFYYALADAFTVCDQNFCSALTGTTPNRLYLWTGNTRDMADLRKPALVRNSELGYDDQASWMTFPERLEDAGLGWKVYQNELSVGVGFQGEEDAWLGNFEDNPLEWFTQYRVKFHPPYLPALPGRRADMQNEIRRLSSIVNGSAPDTDRRRATQRIEQIQRVLASSENDPAEWARGRYAQLPPRARSLHERAFVTNTGDRGYHRLTTLRYLDNGIEREVQVPAGDVLHQFRRDVDTDGLPPVSWLVAPENFSDHPTAPWFGAWYVSEVLNILTRRPEIWQKTIFILCYDENDGYFDHVPPFTPPDPDDPRTGRASDGLDTHDEFLRLDEDRKRQPAALARGSAIGLGFRVPLIVASPWSRGGVVNSQVFDHSSIVQFLEVFASHKTGRPVRETNISAWRRAVCGDLTSVFQPDGGAVVRMPAFLERDAFIETIHRVREKPLPGFEPVPPGEAAEIREGRPSPRLPRQEKGIRPANAIPYQLYATGTLDARRTGVRLRFEARDEVFGRRSAGSAFIVYGPPHVPPRRYAVRPGSAVEDSWPVADFAEGRYVFHVHGPNGYFCEMRGDSGDPATALIVEFEKSGSALSGNIEVQVRNTGDRSVTVEVAQRNYSRAILRTTVPAGMTEAVRIDLSRVHSWYDVEIAVDGFPHYRRRFAGHVETGRPGYTDPLMAGILEATSER